MSAERFLRDYWQKKPLLVRRAFPDFRDPITPEELAGLSCEDCVESRLVRELPRQKRKSSSSSSWDVTWGPQAETVFETLPEEKWTLLVQEVNRWVPRAALLLDRFAFLPNVRVDDVMVSFAATGGSVGPHVDSYDVFLVQGQGKRRWMFHDKPTRDEDKKLIVGIDLRVLERFEPDVDEVLGPGDMLYLPPGFAHYGVAVDACLTYSIGFRSPSAGEAWTSYASMLASSRPEASHLLEDPMLEPADNPGEIPPKLLLHVRKMIRSMDLSDEAIDRWFAAFATQLKPGHSFEAPRRPPNERAIIERVERGDVIARSEEGRFALLDDRSSKNEKKPQLRLYVGGNEIDVAPGATELARLLCRARRHGGEALQKSSKSREARALLASLFAIGALRFV